MGPQNEGGEDLSAELEVTQLGGVDSNVSAKGGRNFSFSVPFGTRT
jgi:hypothetical protein